MTVPLGPTVAACGTVTALFVAVAAAVTGGGRHWTLEDARQARAAAGRLAAPPTLLRDTTGVAGTFALPDTVQVVDFIYTSCPTVCLSLGTAFQQMQHTLQVSPDPALRRVRLLSVSLDPGRDDTAALAAWARRHQAEAVVWRVTSPQTAAAGAALQASLGVVAVPDGTGGFVHNASLHVVDAAGRVRALHVLDDWRAALAAAARLVREGS